jgi:uncharacterized protein with von Willebrand factor type A (vWA) domain
MPRLLDNLLIFGRILRRAGVDVHPGRLLDVVEALGHVNLGERDEVYHTCRTLLVHRHEQLPIFDRAFEAFWREHRHDGAQPGSEPDDVPPPGSTIEVVAPEAADIVSPDDDTEEETASAPERVQIWSDRPGLAGKDFALFTSDELEAADAALSRLAWNAGSRRTRRWIRGHGRRIDLRRAIGESLRTGGDLVRLPRRHRLARPRPLVLLCDVSGSMERYTRMLLHFAHALTGRHRRVETFLFSTELTRITRQLRSASPDEALGAVSRSVPDWSGGTRIGQAVKTFHRRWGRRILHGGPVVLLISDGWDRGDPAELAGEIARLQRSCHRLIWLNPLVGTEDYAPLTRGLQAALPFVDDFLPARTLTNFADLTVHLNQVKG